MNTSSVTNVLADTKTRTTNTNTIVTNINSSDHVDLIVDETTANVQINENFNSQLKCMNEEKNCSASDSNGSPPQLRKRNVNWCSPIKSNACQVAPRNSVKFMQMTEMNGSDHNSHEENIVVRQSQRNEVGNEMGGGDDDGFESLNGKSSSGEEMTAIQHNLDETIELSNGENNSESLVRIGEQYGNSAYTGSFIENDINNNSDNDLISGSNSVPENVSSLTSHIKCRYLVCSFCSVVILRTDL